MLRTHSSKSFTIPHGHGETDLGHCVRYPVRYPLAFDHARNPATAAWDFFQNTQDPQGRSIRDLLIVLYGNASTPCSTSNVL